MIISRTPFRVSFFGGGTDYPVWYSENGGAVLGTTIDKYCYITCRYLPPFFEHKYRVVYSKVETVKDISEIQHPAVKSILQYKDIQQGVEIHHDGDLPARTGLGSSSSFTVGLLHAIYALKGIMPTKINLATEAIHFEKDILKENVGAQDQVLVSIGGFNKVEFRNDGSFHITPITIAKETLNQLQEHCLLYFSGFSRYASEIAKKQIENTGSKKSELTAMQQMVEEAIKILHSKGSAMKDFGELLHESWKLKRSLTDSIATPRIDEIYEAAISAGAMGGKLLGAGGGGFMLFFASPEVHPKIEQRLSDLLRVPFRFEKNGSQVIFYEPNA